MQKPLPLIIAAGLAAVMAALMVAPSPRNGQENPASEQAAANALALISRGATAAEKNSALTELIGLVGPLEAQRRLADLKLPFSIDTHALTHAIGHALYMASGPQSISQCEDFLYFGCYHGAVHSALLDRGADETETLLRECDALGPNIAARCRHGLGHVLLIKADYDLPAALGACDFFHGEPVRNLQSCASGVFMENGTGLTEHAAAGKRWIRLNDPSFPCSDPRIPEIYGTDCWRMQWSVMSAVFKNDIKQIAEGCMSAPTDAAKNACFDYVVGWVMYPEAGDDVDRIFSLCERFSPPGWYEPCLGYAAGQVFEANDHSYIPFEICAQTTGNAKERCYGALSGTIKKVYTVGSMPRAEACNRIEDAPWVRECLDGPEPPLVPR